MPPRKKTPEAPAETATDGQPENAIAVTAVTAEKAVKAVKAATAVATATAKAPAKVTAKAPAKVTAKAPAKATAKPPAKAGTTKTKAPATSTSTRAPGASMASTSVDVATAPTPAAPTSAGEKGNPATIDGNLAERLIGGAHHNPHEILGAHVVKGQVLVRTLRPDAHTVTVKTSSSSYPLEHLWGGIWGAALAGETEVTDYALEVTYGDLTVSADDPYRWLPTLGDVDLHLISEGRHERLWTVLGAHPRSYDTASGTVTGTSFAVWAPNARGVRVMGDFNYWDSRSHPMRSLGSSGVWELFIPDVGPGTRYKFHILGADSVWREKADPMAFQTEVPPSTASIVAAEPSYDWKDSAWMAARADTAAHERPMSTYEVHLGSWRQGLSYRQLADELTAYVLETGFTHVEFLPVAEHPFGGSWGYQVTSYYAPTSRFGTPEDLRYLIDTLHNAGIGVIVDWVPAHFPKDEFALGRFDGTPLYEHGDPRRGEQMDWGTYVFDFGRSEVRNFLVANALFWAEEFHIDGLRVDAVASMLYLDYSREADQWLPNVYGGRENLDAVAFLQEMNATVYKHHPGITTIAEESTAWPGVSRPTHLGGLGFGLKWNMGWMHDTLDYAERDPIYRGYHHHQLTFSMMYAYTENFVLPFSHDEVVHGKGSLLRKMPGDRWQQLANLRALYGYMWTHPGKQLLFMGCEFGQESEWSEERSLDWWLLDNPDHRGIHRLIRDMNLVYKESPALWSQDIDPHGFAWIDANDSVGNTFSYLRWGADGSCMAIVTNFAGEPHEGYRLGLPLGGTWTEVINTDNEVYTGSGVINGSVVTDDVEHHGQPVSATLRVPPLGTVWLRYDG